VKTDKSQIMHCTEAQHTTSHVTVMFTCNKLFHSSCVLSLFACLRQVYLNAQCAVNVNDAYFLALVRKLSEKAVV